MPARIRLYVEAPLQAGAAIEPAPPQSHYLLNVLRARPGDAIGLFNGADGEWQARLEITGRRRCRLLAEERRRAQAPEAGPALLFAPLKRTRQEMLIEKATELGVVRLAPVITERTVVERLNRERLRAIAIEAAEQSERLTIPDIAPPLPLAERLAERANGCVLFMADEAERDGVGVLAALAEHGPGDLLIGPEGGFTPAERDLLHARPEVVPVSLGPRILRAETAAIAALACWQAFFAMRGAHDGGTVDGSGPRSSAAP